MLKYIKSFFQALNANAHPGDIAHAISLGLLLAFVPKANLLWSFLFFLTFFIRVNTGALFVSLILFSFAVPFADIATEMLGYGILSIPFLKPFFTLMYQTPFLGLTRFSNTMVAGGFAAGIITYVPVYFLVISLVAKYRTDLQPKIVNSKLARIISNLPLIKQIIGASSIGEFRK